MFVDLVHHVRCVKPHEDIWLVAAAERSVDRDIVDGLLGCPICRAEYAIRDGIAYFAERRLDAVPEASPANQEAAMRLAAFLDLADPRGVAALVGDWGSHASLLQRLTDAHLALVNPPRGIAVGGGTSGIVSPDVLPFARASLRAIAFDESASETFVASALPALRPRARVVAPASFSVPAGVTELVRDGRVWVGERDAAPSGLVALGRR